MRLWDRVKARTVTSSCRGRDLHLELGIDMGAVDLCCRSSAAHVAAGISAWAGRATPGEISRGVVMPKFRRRPLESAAVVEGMLEGPHRSTTVRAATRRASAAGVAMCAMDEWNIEELGA